MKRFNVKVDGIEYKVDVERIREGVYRVRIGDKTAEVTIEHERSGKVSVKPLKLETKIDEKIKQEKVTNAVTAMLPGTIVKVLVDVGESVKAGQALLILEAMKMENEIVSPKDGVVKEIKVKEGMKVETGEVLMVVE